MNHVENLVGPISSYQNEVVNGFKNPLGIEAVLYGYRLYDNFKDEFGDKFYSRGFAIVYKVNQEVSDKVIKTNGQYLNKYVQDLLKDSYDKSNYRAEYKHNIKDNKNEKECHIFLNEYVWDAITEYSGIFYKYKKQKYMLKDFLSAESFYIRNIYPIIGFSEEYKAIIHNLSDKSYYFVENNTDYRGNIYIYDPINHLYIVSVSDLPNPISCPLK